MVSEEGHTFCPASAIFICSAKLASSDCHRRKGFYERKTCTLQKQQNQAKENAHPGHGLNSQIGFQGKRKRFEIRLNIPLWKWGRVGAPQERGLEPWPEGRRQIQIHRDSLHQLGTLAHARTAKTTTTTIKFTFLTSLPAKDLKHRQL